METLRMLISVQDSKAHSCKFDQVLTPVRLELVERLNTHRA